MSYVLEDIRKKVSIIPFKTHVFAVVTTQDLYFFYIQLLYVLVLKMGESGYLDIAS